MPLKGKQLLLMLSCNKEPMKILRMKKSDFIYLKNDLLIVIVIRKKKYQVNFIRNLKNFYLLVNGEWSFR